MNSVTQKRKISILIPCHNEEEGIADVIRGIPVSQLSRMGFETDIIVIDNDSDDTTAEIASSLGIRVVHEKRKGKGNAIRTGFNAVSDNTDFVVMLDGDNTYKADEIPRLIEPVASGFCDVIVGSRLDGKVAQDAFKLRNRIANWAFTFLVRQFYQANVTDVLSGFFAWKKEVVDVLATNVYSKGFAIEMEMITKMIKLGFELYSVPITYDVRKGSTKLSAFKDGFAILFTFAKNLFWSPSPAGSVARRMYTAELSKRGRLNTSDGTN